MLNEKEGKSLIEKRNGCESGHFYFEKIVTIILMLKENQSIFKGEEEFG